MFKLAFSTLAFATILSACGQQHDNGSQSKSDVPAQSELHVWTASRTTGKSLEFIGEFEGASCKEAALACMSHMNTNKITGTCRDKLAAVNAVIIFRDGDSEFNNINSYVDDICAAARADGDGGEGGEAP